MATAAERARAEESAGQADPVHVDPTQVGTPIDDPKAQEDPPKPAKGVKVDERDGRTLNPWEIDPKKQVGPAGIENRKRSSD